MGAAVVVPTVLAGLTQLWPRPQIEDQLSRTGTDALSAAGFPGAGIVLEGRDATISGVGSADAKRAVDAVQAVTGIRIATAPVGAGGATAPSSDAEPFDVTRRGAEMVLTGVVGSADERSRLVAAATEKASGVAVVDQLTVRSGAAVPSGVDPGSVGAAAAALAQASSDTAISISDVGLTLTGTVADDAARTAVQQAVSTALPGVEVDNQLVVSPPATPTPTPSAGGGAGTGAPAELDATAKQQLQGALTQLLAGAPITFEPDSPSLTAQGRATATQVAERVRAAAGARLQVDGFVATGPGSGRLTAQQLSDRRAAAVRDLLVAGGVPADAIATRGLGEGPAPAAAAAGRRVDITVV